MVRYIHLNPLRAGLVSTLDDLDAYPWCGHSVLMRRNEMSGQSTAEVLLRFGTAIPSATANYRTFIQDGIKMGRRDELVGIGILKGNRALEQELQDSRILGAGDFVDQVLCHTRTAPPENKATLDQIIELVLKKLEISETELMSRAKGGRVALARSIICHAAYSSGYRGIDIARRLDITGSGVTIAARRGKEVIQNYPHLLTL